MLALLINMRIIKSKICTNNRFRRIVNYFKLNVCRH